MTQPCSSCQAAVPSDERFCSACGYDTGRDARISGELEPKLRRARSWILAIGIIYIVSVGLELATAPDSMNASGASLTLAIGCALCAAHVGLWWWAKADPLAAALVALVMFVTLQMAQVAADPSSLARGLIIKGLFLVALIQAVLAGLEVQRLLRDRS